MVVYSYCSSILARALAVNFTATDSLLIFFFQTFGFIECRMFSKCSLQGAKLIARLESTKKPWQTEEALASERWFGTLATGSQSNLIQIEREDFRISSGLISHSKQGQLWDQIELLRALSIQILETYKDGDCTWPIKLTVSDLNLINLNILIYFMHLFISSCSHHSSISGHGSRMWS